MDFCIKTLIFVPLTLSLSTVSDDVLCRLGSISREHIELSPPNGLIIADDLALHSRSRMSIKSRCQDITSNNSEEVLIVKLLITTDDLVLHIRSRVSRTASDIGTGSVP